MPGIGIVRAADPFERDMQAASVWTGPDHVALAIERAGDLKPRDRKGHLGPEDGAQDKDALLIGDDHMDRLGIAKGRHIMDGVLIAAIGAAIGHGAAAHIDNPVAALLDPLDIAIDRVTGRRRLAPALRPQDLPDTAQVGCAGD